ncbi:MAG: ElyC/SanA/YdcF family protein, partial [Arcobacteraceae bacterium]
SEGVLLYHKIGDAKLIFSGYSGNDTVPHAFMQKKLAIELGVKEEDIITFSNPKDTYEEAVAIKELLGNEPFILVTSAFHMSRAIDTFNFVGLSPIPAPTGHKLSNIDYFKRPSGYDIQKSETAVWEYLGLLFNKLKSIF